MSSGFDSRTFHKEPSTRKDVKDSAKSESVSDESGGGSLNEMAKSVHKHIAEHQEVAREASRTKRVEPWIGQQRETLMRPPYRCVSQVTNAEGC